MDTSLRCSKEKRKLLCELHSMMSVVQKALDK